MKVSQDHVKIAKFVAGAIGLEPHVYPYYDNDRDSSIDVLDLVDPLDRNVKFYCSVGVSDCPNIIEMKDGSTINIPVELLIAAYKDFEKAPNILSTCGFYMINDRRECQPGSVYKRMVETYYPGSDMKHIMFTRPFLWEDKLEPLQVGDKNVSFLLCIPVSDAELEYRNDNGVNALESLLFGQKNIDIFDLDRKSVL